MNKVSLHPQPAHGWDSTAAHAKPNEKEQPLDLSMKSKPILQPINVQSENTNAAQNLPPVQPTLHSSSTNMLDIDIRHKVPSSCTNRRDTDGKPSAPQDAIPLVVPQNKRITPQVHTFNSCGSGSAGRIAPLSQSNQVRSGIKAKSSNLRRAHRRVPMELDCMKPNDLNSLLAKTVQPLDNPGANRDVSNAVAKEAKTIMIPEGASGEAESGAESQDDGYKKAACVSSGAVVASTCLEKNDVSTSTEDLESYEMTSWNCSKNSDVCPLSGTPPVRIPKIPAVWGHCRRASDLPPIDNEIFAPPDFQTDVLFMMVSHLPRLHDEGTGKDYIVVGDLKEVMFPWCESPRCKIFHDLFGSFIQPLHATDKAPCFQNCTANEIKRFADKNHLVLDHTKLVRLDTVTVCLSDLYQALWRRHCYACAVSSKYPCQLRLSQTDFIDKSASLDEVNACIAYIRAQRSSSDSHTPDGDALGDPKFTEDQAVKSRETVFLRQDSKILDSIDNHLEDRQPTGMVSVSGVVKKLEKPPTQTVISQDCLSGCLQPTKNAKYFVRHFKGQLIPTCKGNRYRTDVAYVPLMTMLSLFPEVHDQLVLDPSKLLSKYTKLGMRRPTRFEANMLTRIRSACKHIKVDDDSWTFLTSRGLLVEWGVFLRLFHRAQRKMDKKLKQPSSHQESGHPDGVGFSSDKTPLDCCKPEQDDISDVRAATLKTSLRHTPCQEARHPEHGGASGKTVDDDISAIPTYSGHTGKLSHDDIEKRVSDVSRDDVHGSSSQHSYDTTSSAEKPIAKRRRRRTKRQMRKIAGKRKRMRTQSGKKSSDSEILSPRHKRRHWRKSSPITTVVPSWRQLSLLAKKENKEQDAAGEEDIGSDDIFHDESETARDHISSKGRIVPKNVKSVHVKIKRRSHSTPCTGNVVTDLETASPPRIKSSGDAESISSVDKDCLNSTEPYVGLIKGTWFDQRPALKYGGGNQKKSTENARQKGVRGLQLLRDQVIKSWKHVTKKKTSDLNNNSTLPNRNLSIITNSQLTKSTVAGIEWDQMNEKEFVSPSLNNMDGQTTDDVYDFWWQNLAHEDGDKKLEYNNDVVKDDDGKKEKALSDKWGVLDCAVVHTTPHDQDHSLCAETEGKYSDNGIKRDLALAKAQSSNEVVCSTSSGQYIDLTNSDSSTCVSVPSYHSDYFVPLQSESVQSQASDQDDLDAYGLRSKREQVLHIRDIVDKEQEESEEDLRESAELSWTDWIAKMKKTYSKKTDSIEDLNDKQECSPSEAQKDTTVTSNSFPAGKDIRRSRTEHQNEGKFSQQDKARGCDGAICKLSKSMPTAVVAPLPKSQLYESVHVKKTMLQRFLGNGLDEDEVGCSFELPYDRAALIRKYIRTGRMRDDSSGSQKMTSHRQDDQQDEMVAEKALQEEQQRMWQILQAKLNKSHLRSKKASGRHPTSQETSKTGKQTTESEQIEHLAQQFKAEALYTSEGESQCGKVFCGDSCIPYVLRNGFKYVAAKEAHVLLGGCEARCQAVKKIVSQMAVLQPTMCSFEEVSLMQSLHTSKKSMVGSGDVIVRLDLLQSNLTLFKTRWHEYHRLHKQNTGKCALPTIFLI